MRPYNILKISSRQEQEVALSQPQDKILLATNNMDEIWSVWRTLVSMRYGV